jgi:hypothetical protein
MSENCLRKSSQPVTRKPWRSPRRRYRVDTRPTRNTLIERAAGFLCAVETGIRAGISCERKYRARCPPASETIFRVSRTKRVSYAESSGLGRDPTHNYIAIPEGPFEGFSLSAGLANSFHQRGIHVLLERIHDPEPAHARPQILELLGGFYSRPRHVIVAFVWIDRQSDSGHRFRRRAVLSDEVERTTKILGLRLAGDSTGAAAAARAQ